jgi:hypothetical protein
MKRNIKIWPLLFCVALLCWTCSKDETVSTVPLETNYITENVIIVVIDGPRYSETWGDPQKEYVPRLKNELAPDGVINENFHNLGVTRTVPGHTAILTGTYEDIENSGNQFPSNPSLLQLWLDETKLAPDHAQIFSSKKKLDVLGNSTNLEWRNSFVPNMDATDRDDWITYLELINALKTERPNLVFMNLKGPDINGHANNWSGYLDAIEETDSLLAELKIFIDNDPHYSGKTTLIMTNDHGRHLDGIRNGFVDHGDNCLGCTHINFYGYGPDFKAGITINNERELIDIAPTVAHLLGFRFKGSRGDIMTELFK